MTQQEGADLLALAGAVSDRRLASAHEIAHRFMGLVRCPDLGQLAGPEQAYQLHGVAAVGLHPLAGPARDQGRCDDGAVVSEPLDQTLQPVARRPGLVAEAKPRARPLKLVHETTDGSRIRGDLAEIPDLTIASAFRHRNGVAVLRYVHSDENLAIVDHGSPSWLEALLTEQPSLRSASVGRTAPAPAGPEGHTVLPDAPHRAARRSYPLGRIAPRRP